MKKLTKALEHSLSPFVKSICNKTLETNSWMEKLIDFYKEEMGSDSSDSSSSSSKSSSR